MALTFPMVPTQISSYHVLQTEKWSQPTLTIASVSRFHRLYVLIFPLQPRSVTRQGLIEGPTLGRPSNGQAVFSSRLRCSTPAPPVKPLKVSMRAQCLATAQEILEVCIGLTTAPTHFLIALVSIIMQYFIKVNPILKLTATTTHRSPTCPPTLPSAIARRSIRPTRWL